MYAESVWLDLCDELREPPRTVRLTEEGSSKANAKETKDVGEDLGLVRGASLERHGLKEGWLGEGRKGV